MKNRLLMLLILVVVTLYMTPQITARFTGSHTMQFNNTSKVQSIKCTGCHEYILNELSASPASVETYAKHRAAAGNSTYTEGWLNLTIDNSTDYGICQMCHTSQIADIDSHTKTLVRACIDLDCHGNNGTTNNNFTTMGNMGPLLGAKNVHERVFDTLSGRITPYLNETGTNYSQAFLFCIACHTEVQASLDYSNVGSEYFLHDDSSTTQRRYL